ncbi:hypothetical protein MARINOS108_10503 [Marinoscillum sp. 108]|nr:hypothetical protein MARINOS108_10503 [Marinoscillum sp. 108]
MPEDFFTTFNMNAKKEHFPMNVAVMPRIGLP